MNRVVDQTAEEGDITAGSNLEKEIGGRGSSREARIDDDHLRIAFQLCFDGPFEATRVVLGRITTHDQHHVGVLDVDPAVGHCAASEGGPQTGDRRTVSNSGLRFEIADPEAAHCLDREIIQFVGVGTTAGPTNAFAPVYRKAFLVFLHKRFIARFLYPASDFIKRIVPGNIFPVIGTGPTHLRFQQAAVVVNFLLERSAFWTKSAAIDRMIGITFNVDNLWSDVLGPVTNRVNDDAATDGTIWTRAARFRRAVDLQTLCLRVNRSEIETERR